MSESTFQPTLPARGATFLLRICVICILFQPTLPARGATVPSCDTSTISCNFNPRSPHGERRPTLIVLHTWSLYFNPRSPHGERQRHFDNIQSHLLISTHAPRTGSDLFDTPPTFTPEAISTHAPRTGSDSRPAALPAHARQISTHAPRTGSDPCRPRKTSRNGGFQPTLPARGATRCPMIQATVVAHFNPRSPHGERPSSTLTSYALRGFQPTLPARGATYCV